MFDRFDENARAVMGFAREAALDLNHDYIGTEHLLLGLARQWADGASSPLAAGGVSPERVREEVKGRLEAGARVLDPRSLQFTPHAKGVLVHSLKEAEALAARSIRPEHVLLGLLHVEEGIAAQSLATLGVTIDDVRGAM